MNKELEAMTYELSKKYPHDITLQEYFCKVADLVNKATPPTADDMFEKLGFKLKETEEYYIYTLKKYTQWKIYISKKYGSYYVSLSDTSIAKSDHQAIHQKLIELGWIE
ncbi:MAG: hypothetical protein RBT65_19245 [Methanolobus sp.]|nr:hypothetical protein [Methanolobus sp.]